jgi:hypothetical protein
MLDIHEHQSHGTRFQRHPLLTMAECGLCEGGSMVWGPAQIAQREIHKVLCPLTPIRACERLHVPLSLLVLMIVDAVGKRGLQEMGYP